MPIRVTAINHRRPARRGPCHPQSFKKRLLMRMAAFLHLFQ